MKEIDILFDDYILLGYINEMSSLQITNIDLPTVREHRDQRIYHPDSYPIPHSRKITSAKLLLPDRNKRVHHRFNLGMKTQKPGLTLSGRNINGAALLLHHLRER
jgi:hypothetical protein